MSLTPEQRKAFRSDAFRQSICGCEACVERQYKFILEKNNLVDHERDTRYDMPLLVPGPIIHTVVQEDAVLDAYMQKVEVTYRAPARLHEPISTEALSNSVHRMVENTALHVVTVGFLFDQTEDWIVLVCEKTSDGYKGVQIIPCYPDTKIVFLQEKQKI
jgi:hypothetical protein